MVRMVQQTAEDEEYVTADITGWWVWHTELLRMMGIAQKAAEAGLSRLHIGTAMDGGD